VVKSAVDMTKPLVPVVQRVVTAADPWVDTVDAVVTSAVQTVNSRVIEPARDPQGHITVSGVYASVTQELRHGYDALVDMSDHAVDRLLPESSKLERKEEDSEHAKSILEVSSKAQNRVMESVETQWKNARAFSSGSLKEVIHVDLIETAANGYTLSLAMVQNNVLPLVNELSGRGAALATSSQSAYVSVRDVSAEKSKLLWDSIREQSHEAYKFASDKAEEYRVPEIVEKAKELSISEISEYVLVTLKIKGQNEHFVIAQRKLYDLFRTVLGVNLSNDSSKTESAPVPKMTEVY